MALDLNELTAADVAVGADSIAIIDADDNSTKKESIVDLVAGFASQANGGIGADSGKLVCDLNDLSAAAVDVAADSIAIVDSDNSNQTRKESVADLMTAVAGDGLVASSGVLAVNVADMATSMSGDVADEDEFAISDGGTMKKVDFSVVRDAVFADVSGDATVAAGGALTIASDAVESGMLNDNVISGQTDIGGALAITDEILVSDGGTLRRTDLSRFATMMAGDQLTAASGQIHFRLEITEVGDTDDLTQGVHYLGDLTSDATLALPASPDFGDQVTVKAKGLTDAVVIINRAGSQTIDGETSVTIESPYGAVTMVYVATNDWRLI